MKIIKEHPIFGVGLLFGVLAILLLVLSPKATPLTSYAKTTTIQINDGNTGVEEFDANKGTVESILYDLDIELGDEDSLNYDLSHELQEDEIIEITRVTYEEDRKQIAIPFEVSYVESSDPSLVGNRLLNYGQDGVEDIVYNVKKINGQEVDRQEITREVATEPVHETYEVGTTTTGYVFSGKLTSYGADCIGCGTRTAAGLYVTINGVKNEPKATLSFNGGEYYVVAADKQFPFGTIVKISNHNYNLPDPLYAIVLDRGGAVKGTTMDIFSGSQASPLFAGHGSTVTYEIIQYGDGRTSIY